MSNTDSFIEEVNEEVRRDRLFGYLRKYGWIGGLVVVLIVGGTAYSEWRDAQKTAQAQAFGDAILEALSTEDADARLAALTALEGRLPEQVVPLSGVRAAELARAGDVATAAQELTTLAENDDVPEIYRRIARFRALLIQADTLPVAERQAQFEAFAVPGNALRVLAEEQLALIAVEQGDTDGAIARLHALLEDAEAGAGGQQNGVPGLSALQQRAMQVIVALGGAPDLSARGLAEN